ncbi:MAG: type II toxin-antitoxin system prevent-host-death family antitoxin [Bifidobacteriaceae bacterium]|jgi:prevent-host-death family protein|nr:type II toxin-antitoxin system prevent-host-death family antitoxin [Bifidobacteriaceae bacterium]
MTSVGIRELKQNASQVVARAGAGEVLTITDRGRPVARLVPLVQDRVQELVEAGLAIAPRGELRFPEPTPRREGPTLSEMVIAAREDERY